MKLAGAAALAECAFLCGGPNGSDYEDMAERLVVVDKAPVNETVLHGAPPMLLACRAGSVRLVRVLLAAGARRVWTDARGNSVFHVVCMLGSELLLRTLLDAQGTATEERELAMLVDAPNDEGLSPLHIAARHNSVKTVRLLASHPLVNPARHGPGNATAVHYAAVTGHAECLVVLLEALRRRFPKESQQFINSNVRTHDNRDSSTVAEVSFLGERDGCAWSASHPWFPPRLTPHSEPASRRIAPHHQSYCQSSAQHARSAHCPLLRLHGWLGGDGAVALHGRRRRGGCRH